VNASIIPLLVAFILFASLFSIVLYMPSTTPSSPWNNSWNGLSTILEELRPEVTGDLNSTTCSSLILLVLERPLTSGEVNGLTSLLECGAIVVISDSSGYSRDLLEELGISVEFAGHLVLDEVSAFNYRWVVKANTSGLASLTLTVPNATAISAYPPPDAITAYTSRYAYVDLNDDGFYELNEPMGQQLLLGGWRVGGGLVVLVPSRLFLSNSNIMLVDNLEFVRQLGSGRRIYLYTGTIELGFFDRVKEALYKWSAGRPLYITHLVALVTSFTLAFAWLPGSALKNMSKRGTLLALAILSSMPYLAAAYLYANAVYLAPLAALVLLVVLRPLLSIPLIISMSLVATGFNPVYLLLYIAITLALGGFISVEEGRGILGYTSLSLLSLQGVNALTIIIYPQLVLGLLAASLTVITVAIIEYATCLKPIIIEPITTSSEVYVGSRINIGFLVKSTRRAVYFAETWRSRVVKPADPGGVIGVSEIVEHIGVNRVNVRISASDTRGFAYRHIGIYSFEFNALPMTTRLLERAREILGRIGAGALPSEVSLTVLMRLDELGRLLPIPGEKLGEALVLMKQHGEVAGMGFITRLIEEYIEASRKARIGEYIGVRMYEPGDPFKTIHWKKSLSKQMLVSREYSASGGSERRSSSGGAGSVLYIANLDAPNPLELDAVIAGLLGSIVDIASRSSRQEVDLIMVSGRYITTLKGPASSVLRLLYDSLRENPLGVRYSYESINRYLSIEELLYINSGGSRVLEAMSTALNTSSRVVAEALLKSGYTPPRQYTVIHGRALSTWASNLIYTLNSLGYAYVPFTGAPSG